MVGVSYLPVKDARVAPPQLEAGGLLQEFGEHREYEGNSANVGGFIALIESRAFLAECFRRSVQSAFRLPIFTYSTVTEFERSHHDVSPDIVILSLLEGNNEASVNVLKILAELVPKIPVVVLAYKNDSELARIAICNGAKGFIPVTMGFEIAVQAVRFVLAGGTYVPTDCMFATSWPGAAQSPPPPKSGAITSRELAVVRAIQQGKPNKVIAYELNMCESTVKVHVRNIMKKLNAKNRTDLAVKSQML
ncbi:MAG: response regulator transcription factor [Hyphomicrobiales bacterium]|nr:response regulator transcription factor [Hyphomicrobiales bacterium]MBV8441302.1 response regulator transcription factor [Hyphomicrobiales bacterium]